MFTVLTILSLLFLTAVLTYRRFKEGTEGIDQAPLKERANRYFSALWSQSKVIIKPEGFRRLKVLYLNWIDRHSSGWTKWFFIGLSLSSAYLVFSGFFYSLFIARGLFGLPLLLHIVAGGIFAICLTAVVLLRARYNTLGSILPLEVRILFWLIVAMGFFLILTALGSMMPFFPLSSQRELIGLHRYSALVGLLSSFAYFHFSQNGKEE